MPRADVTFRSDDADCAAWLYTPDDTSGPAEPAAEPGHGRPVIVMAHGLGGVREERLDAFAERFAAAGYACLVFDYRHFGASGGEPRQLLTINRQRADWRAAVAFARTLDGVDPERVVLWGTSFGGGHVIVTAAGDSRVAATVAQCPFTSGLASTLRVPPLTSVRLTTRALRDLTRSRLGRPPLMVPTYGDPGDVALMSAPDVVAGVENLASDDVAPPREVAARFALDIVRSRPGRQARSVRCPILFVVSEHDSVAPSGPTQRYAARAPQGETIVYDAGHFDLYVGEQFERNVTDQLEFLTRHVPVA